MGTLVSVEQFVREELPRIVQGKRTLSALFATYNNVADHESGPVETRKQGLTIGVQNGGLHYDPFALVALTVAVDNPGDPMAAELGDMGHAVMHEQAVDAQEIMAQGVTISSDAPGSFIAFVYAGLSAFDEAISFAQSLRAKVADATIVILTCDCDPWRKESELLPLIQRGEIQHAVMTRECGGRGAMADMLDGLIAAWPAELSAPKQLPAPRKKTKHNRRSA